MCVWASITPAWLRVLDSADDDGRVKDTRPTTDRMVEVGLLELRGLGQVPHLTNAGWNALFLFPNIETPAHQTRTWVDSYETVWRPRPNGRDTFTHEPASSWKCTCGAYGGGRDREEARRGARNHREQAAAS